MNEITTTTDNKQVAQRSEFEALANKYLSNCGQQIPNGKAQEFIEIAKALNLNPFKREIYMVGYGEKYNIVTGYEVYLKRAERSGKLNGWSVDVSGNFILTQKGTLDPKSNLRADLTIYRKDWEKPFKFSVFISEVVQTKKDGTVNSMWRKMPAFMIRKDCIAQGFRMCFPDELGGMPYVEGELGDGDEKEIKVADVTRVETESVEPSQPYTPPTPPMQTVEDAQIVNKVEVVEETKPISQPVQSQITVNDMINALNNWCKQYKKALNVNLRTGQNPYSMVADALDCGSDGEIIAIYNRTKQYLNRCGINA
jgi:phage recombination protein Bet